MLSFSLDQDIPMKINNKKIKTEFERFFFRVQKFMKDLNQQARDELKTKHEKIT